MWYSRFASAAVSAFVLAALLGGCSSHHDQARTATSQRNTTIVMRPTASPVQVANVVTHLNGDRNVESFTFHDHVAGYGEHVQDFPYTSIPVTVITTPGPTEFRVRLRPGADSTQVLRKYGGLPGVASVMSQ